MENRPNEVPTSTVVLLTIRVRHDPDRPNRPLFSVRRYPVTGVPMPEASAEVADVAEAIRLVETWLRELESQP